MKHTTQLTPEVHEDVESWHHHSSDEGEPQSEHASKVDTRALGVVFGGVVVFFVVTVIVTTLYFIRYTTNLRQEKIETTTWAVEHSRWMADQTQTLARYGWADAAAGTVRVPIDVAQQRVIAKYAGK